ncbi:MAG: ATP-dependent Clp protease ATP-binding subunit ClpA [Sphingomonadales bacterium]|nr:ATP-dependent Clp protease ATP-binding subunit ClpA [Sphingomonadales bacterium]
MEHLLYALIDDEHASRVMSACGVDLVELKEAVTHYLDVELDAIKADDYFAAKESEPEASIEEDAQPAKISSAESSSEESAAANTEAEAKVPPLTRAQYDEDGPTPTSGFQRVVQRSILHVESSGRKEVTGANVLVALFSERESYAVYFLQQQDMSRLDAVSYISHGHGVGKGEADEPVSAELEPSEGADQPLLPRVLRNDLRPHSDGVPAEPSLSTREVAQKIADFLGETVTARALQSSVDDRVPLVTVGIFGP